MFLDFFTRLRAAGIPVSLGELLDLHAALDAGRARRTVDLEHAIEPSEVDRDDARKRVGRRRLDPGFSGRADGSHRYQRNLRHRPLIATLR